ncbi:MAG: NTP transferase domain-containing protein [Streptococcaceae bacterium]|jgi:molybdopterin-guanine dinucleotide biosynthesis protein A|nr:NTP transferase domain-containing protein [Streptococcaceae bacterium]
MTYGIFLAGGGSRRFATGDKALFENWAQLAVEHLSALTERVFIVASPTNAHALTAKFPSATVLCDAREFAGEGPLVGLYTVSKQTQDFENAQSYLILPSDSPEITRVQILKLLSADNVYVRENFPICHLTFSHQQLADFLATGERRFYNFLKCLDAKATSFKDLPNHNEK